MTHQTDPIQDLRFLVVEDHGFQRWAICQLLQGMGATVVFEADSGQAALEILRDPDTPIDIIIGDFDLPGIDRMDFIRHVGDLGKPPSIILASALDPALVASIETMTTAYGINLLGTIEKPITAAALDAAIRLHARSRAKFATNRKSQPVFALDEVVAGIRAREFEPFFQPKIELATGAINGAEALARWRHPHWGIVAPGAFIEQLDAGNHIDELTFNMLDTATVCCRNWLRNGLDASVSLNLSIKSLEDVEMSDRITALVLAKDLDPKHVVFEVNESAATTHLVSVLENLSRLHLRGFGLSIDDYGTGCSSMQQVSRIAFSELKIDQSLVRGASKQAASRAILESSLEMAKRLNIVAVAKGVETQIELDLLRSLGCDMCQGYYFAAPMDIGAFFHWVKSWSPRI